MLRQHSRLIDSVLRLADVAILAAALPIAAFAREWLKGGVNTYVPGDRLLQLLALTLIGWTVASWLFTVYDVYRTRPLATELSRIASALGGVAVLAAATSHLVHRLEVPRLLLVLYFGLALALLVATRLGLRRLAGAARRRGRNLRYYAVVGSGDLAEEVIRGMDGHPEWGFELAGLVLDAEPAAAPGRPVLGRLDELPRLLEERVLDQVIFAVPPGRLVAVEESARTCQEQGVAVMICLDLLHGGIGRMALTQVESVPALTFTTVPSDDLALAMKRVFDLVVSGVALLLLAPVLAAVAVAIKLDSPGPVFFRQRRVGLNGREFTLLKFRSMRTDAEAQLAALRARNEMTGPVFKMTNDPRVTRIGRFIRKTSLDEFPQFWNVLVGQMSVVGPRPPIPAEVRQYQRWQRRRLSVKPGITCTWQVSGRNDIDFEQWMRLDLQYIDSWSLWGDIQICLKTVPAVLAARGAS